jgi:hypothetical protein
MDKLSSRLNLKATQMPSEGRELKVSDNVYGALIVATLQAEAGGIGFFQCFSVCVLTILAQISFMYWVHINALTFDLGGGACSIHPTLKFTSVAVFMATQSSVIPSIEAHLGILQFYLMESAASLFEGFDKLDEMKTKSVFLLRALFLIIFSVLPELLLTVFYVPVGIHYIMVQPTLDTTILATVALQFILDVDEIVFKTFPWRFRNRCEVLTFNTKGSVASDIESKLTRMASESDSDNHDNIEVQRSKAAAWGGFYSQIVLVVMCIGCVFGFIDHIFVCSRWNETAPGKKVQVM